MVLRSSRVICPNLASTTVRRSRHEKPPIIYRQEMHLVEKNLHKELAANTTRSYYEGLYGE